MRHYSRAGLTLTPKRFGVTLQSRGGFTLIELIVVTVITGMLSSFIILYNNASRQQIALSVESAKISQVILRAKSLAISTYATSNIPCGYGVSFDPQRNSYALFRYDRPSSQVCRDIATLDPSRMHVIDQYAVNVNVKLSASVAVTNRMDAVLFVPPDPTTIIITGGVRSGQPGAVYLETQDAQYTSKVGVNNSGQVSF